MWRTVQGWQLHFCAAPPVSTAIYPASFGTDECLHTDCPGGAAGVAARAGRCLSNRGRVGASSTDRLLLLFWSHNNNGGQFH